jgi:hypothetical protein
MLGLHRGRTYDYSEADGGIVAGTASPDARRRILAFASRRRRPERPRGGCRRAHCRQNVTAVIRAPSSSCVKIGCA